MYVYTNKMMRILCTLYSRFSFLYFTTYPLILKMRKFENRGCMMMGTHIIHLSLHEETFYVIVVTRRKVSRLFAGILVRKNGVYVTTALSHSLSFLSKIHVNVCECAVECYSIFWGTKKENFQWGKITVCLTWGR